MSSDDSLHATAAVDKFLGCRHTIQAAWRSPASWQNLSIHFTPSCLGHLKSQAAINWYVTQNYKSGKQIAWRQLRAMLLQEMFAKKNEAELSVEPTNGSVIALKTS